MNTTEKPDIVENYERCGIDVGGIVAKIVKLAPKGCLDGLERIRILDYDPKDIGLAMGHEIDHHVNRNNFEIDKEQSAVNMALSYIYPSLGII